MVEDKKKRAPEVGEPDESEDFESDCEPEWDKNLGKDKHVDPDKEVADFVKQVRPRDDAALAAILGGSALSSLINSAKEGDSKGLQGKPKEPEANKEEKKAAEAKGAEQAGKEGDNDKELKAKTAPADELSANEAKFKSNTEETEKRLLKMRPEEQRAESSQALVDTVWQKHIVDLLKQMGDDGPRIKEPAVNSDELKEKIQKNDFAKMSRTELIAAVMLESNEGKFGPASEFAHKATTEWFNGSALNTYKDLIASGLRMPAGGPIPSFTFGAEAGSVLGANPSAFKARILADSFKLDDLKEMSKKGQIETQLNLDASTKHGIDQLIRFENSKGWLESERNRLAQNSNQIEANRRYQVISDILGIKDEGWKPPEDPGKSLAYCQRADEVCNKMFRVRNYAETIKSLSSIDGDFKLKALDPKEFPGTLSWGKLDGTPCAADDPEAKCLLKMNLNLPDSLACTPENERKLQALQNWLDKYGPRVEQALGDYKKGAPVRYGDFVESGKVRQDKDGNTVSILDSSNTMVSAIIDGKLALRNTDGIMRDAKTGERVEANPKFSKEEKFDYIGDKFSTRRDEKGQIVVEIDRSYEKDNPLNYNRWFGSQVGNVKETRTYKPDDLVTVQNSSGLPQLIRADRLAEFQQIQAFWHHGSKLATCAMDVGMVVTGSVGARAAFQAGRMLYVAANVGRAVLGLGGFLDPTFRQMGELGENLRKARHVAILLDVTQGLLRQAPSAIGSGKVLFETAGAAEVQKIIEASTTMRRLHSATSKVFAVCDAVYLPMMSKDVIEKARLNMGYNPQQMLDDANAQIGSGRGAEKSFAKLTPKEAEEVRKEMLRVYEKLMDVKDPSQKEAVAKRFEEIRSKMGSDSAEAYKTKELAAFYFPSGTQLQDLKKKNSDALPRFFDDREKTGTYEEKVAAAIGLLQLSVKDNKFPADGILMSRKTEVPAYTKVEYGPEGEKIETEIKAETVTQELSIKQVIASLQDASLNATSPETRAVAADALYRLGAVGSGRYASILLEHLEKDPSSPENKDSRFKMMYQVANLIDASRASEALPPSDADARRFLEAESFGASSEELIRRMQGIAASESDPDLRAMAMAILHSQSSKEADKKLESYAKQYESLKNNPGKFREEFLAELKADLNTPVSADASKEERDAAIEKRLHAAAAFRNFEGSKLEEKTFQSIDINKSLHECLIATGRRQIKDKSDAERSSLNLTLKTIDALMSRKDTLTLEQRKDIAATATGIMEVACPKDAAARKEPALAQLGIIARMNQIYEISEPQDRSVTDPLKTQRSAMVSALKGIIRIDDELPIKSGWGEFPEMRVAALVGLKNLGLVDKDTSDMIAAFLDYDETKTGPGAFKERNPNVRAAAADALYSLAEYRLRYSSDEIDKMKAKNQGVCENLGLNPKLYVDELLKRERDPVVLDVLWRVFDRKQRLDPKSAQYENQFALESTVLDSRRHIATTNEMVMSFVNRNPGLKNLDPRYLEGEVKRTAEQRRQDPYDGFWGYCSSWVDSRATSRQKNESATATATAIAWTEKNKDRNESLTNLSRLGELPPADQEMAVKTLLHLISCPDSDLLKNVDTKYVRTRASEMLLRLCNAEDHQDVVKHKELLSRVVVSGLLDSAIQTLPQVKLNLLKCVDALTVKDPKLVAEGQNKHWLITPEQAAIIYTRALQREKQEFRPDHKDEAQAYQATRAIQLYCIQKLYDLRAHTAEVALDARGENPSLKKNLSDVSQASKDVLTALRYGITHLQRDAVVDKNSSLSDRAELMRAALNDEKFNYESACIAMFRACKDKPIEKPRGKEKGAEDREDARVPVLLQALTHENERVRMAAASILADSKVDSHFMRACEALATLATSGSKDRYRADASALLRDIILRGQPVEQDIAYAAWKSAYDAQKQKVGNEGMESVPAPLPIPDAQSMGERKVPVAELDKLISAKREELSDDEKKAIETARIKNISVLTGKPVIQIEAELNAPPINHSLLNKSYLVAQPMSAIKCHQSQSAPNEFKSYDLAAFFEKRQPLRNLNPENNDNNKKLAEWLRSKDFPAHPDDDSSKPAVPYKPSPERREQLLSDMEARYGVLPFVTESLRNGKPEIGRPVWGQVRHRESDRLPDAEKTKQNEVIASTLLERRLADADSVEDKVAAIKDSCLRTPLVSSEDRRLNKIADLLKDKDEVLRIEAANLILRGSKDNFVNKGFSEAQRQNAYTTLAASSNYLIQKGITGNDPAALTLLDRALEFKENSSTRSLLSKQVESRAAGWEKANVLLGKHLKNEPFEETLADGKIRQTRIIDVQGKAGTIISERKGDLISKVITPDGVKYADVLLRDLSLPNLKAEQKLSIARSILESSIDIGKSKEHTTASLIELSKLCADNATAASVKLDSAKLFLKAAGTNAEGMEQVWKALTELSLVGDLKDSAKATLLQLDKAATSAALIDLKNSIIKDPAGNMAKPRLELALALAEKCKSEPIAEAALLQLYPAAKAQNDEALLKQLEQLIDRSKANSGLSPITGKDDPRLAIMSKLLQTDDNDVPHLSAALALSDASSKGVSEDDAKNARIQLHQFISSELESLRQRERTDSQQKPSDADWAKLDFVMQSVGQNKNDYGRLYIESKRLELKNSYADLASVYEKLADISKERESNVAERLFRDKAAEAKQMADPKIQAQLAQFRKDLFESQNTQKDSANFIEKQNKLEASLKALSEISGADSRISANAYLDIARYYAAKGDIQSAENASANATRILNDIARANVEHLKSTPVYQGESGSVSKGKRLASNPLEFGGEKVAVKDNGTLSDLLDYQFSCGVVGSDASNNAKRIALRTAAVEESLFGKDSPQAKQAKENLGDILLTSGNRTEAESMYRQALQSPTTFGIEKGRLTAKLSETIMNNGPQGELQAIKMMEDSLIAMQREGVDPLTLSAQMKDYATLMQRRGDFKKADDFVKRAEHLSETGQLKPASTGGAYASLYPGMGPGGPVGPGGQQP